MIRVRWPVVLALTALGALAGVFATFAVPVEYTSTTRVFVTPEVRQGSTATELARANSLALDRVQSYAQVVTTPRVLDRVSARLGLGVAGEALADEVSVSVAPLSVIMDISATAGSAQESADIANAVREEFRAVLVEDLERTGDGTGANVRLETLQEAAPPSSPSAPDVKQSAILGGFAGLLVGLAALVIFGLLDKKIHNRGEVESQIDTPVLASIPRTRSDGNGTGHDPALIGPYQSLRDMILLAEGDTRTVALTSASARVDSSLVSTRLARAFAASGRRVVLVDGDLMTRKISQAFDLTDQPGLAERTQGDYSGVLASTGIQNLFVLGAGQATSIPDSSGMPTVINELTQVADVVIVDSPPALVNGDAMIISDATDTSLVVIPAGAVTAGDIESTVASLKSVSANVAGTVMVNVPVKGPDSDPQTRAVGYAARKRGDS